MKWRPVKRVNLLVMVFSGLVALAVLAFMLLRPAPGKPPADTTGGFQMGFYDLMSNHKEIYDVQLATTRGILMTTISNPDDNRFMLKGKFTPAARARGRIYFNLTPIFYNSGQEGLMIDGLVDQLMHSNYWMEPLSLANQSLVVGQNGSIFLYPLHN